MTLSLHKIAADCLKLTGTVSLRKDIVSLHADSPPYSLQETLYFVGKTYCLPVYPPYLELKGIADRRIDIAWAYPGGAHNTEDGFLIEFQGKRPDFNDHIGSESVDRNVNQLSLDNLYSGYEYTIAILAFNAFGKSTKSEAVKGRTPPRIISAGVLGGSRPLLEWLIEGKGFTANSQINIFVGQISNGDNSPADIYRATSKEDGTFSITTKIGCSGSRLSFYAVEENIYGTVSNTVDVPC
jgi:hypothetical protein